ncbi:ATP-binding protein [Halomonas sp. HNIBRBA4712]|uniref:ATP-binding protein n=1 Tax=Halomonas sp. HNIBRBA4712 TaxID=3373087 RepID=UPI0037453DC8
MSLNARTLLALVGLPLLIYAVMATALVVQGDQTQRQLYIERLTSTSKVLAPALSDALIDGDEPLLTLLSRQFVEHEYLRALSLFDAQGNRVVALGRPFTPARRRVAPSTTRLLEEQDVWRLLMPLPAYPASSAADNGWLEAEISARPLTVERYRLMAGLALGALALGALLLALARYCARSITRPLERSRNALTCLAQGEYERRLNAHAMPELDRLGQQINRLGEHLVHQRRDMQRQMERVTRELYESMETIEAQSIKLDMAHQSALSANEVKSRFLANMSHEIRTPLNAITGFCRLLGRTELDARQREWLEQVHRGCDHLLALVNDVLDFSKLEADQLTLEEVPFEIATLIDDAISLNAPQAQRKGLHLVGLAYDDIPTPLMGDPLRIQQILNNLIGNALKFTAEGEVVVRASLEKHQGQHVILEISVADTGIGLDEAQQRDLFDAFTQAEPSHSREYGGTGLGLSICRQLVERMGGEIRVESSPGEGARFSFTLALMAFGARERPPAFDLAQAVVRLHEPHRTTRLALESWLDHLGAQAVSFADTGNEALLVLALGPQDFIGKRRAYWDSVIEQAPCPTLILVLGSRLDLPEWPLPRGGEILEKPVTRRQLELALERLLRPQATEPAREHAERLPSSSTVNVLAVDDNASNRALLKALLESERLKVTLADSGPSALECARAQAFDVVLMDIRMPGMDGVETSRALRRLGNGWARCPIIAVTAHVASDQRARWLIQGFDDVLLKPIDESALHRLLERFLDLPAPLLADDSPSTRSGYEQFQREQRTALIAELPQVSARIETAFKKDQGKALLDEVHALSGACCYCDLPALGSAANAVEATLVALEVEHREEVSLEPAQAPLASLFEEIRALT